MRGKLKSPAPSPFFCQSRAIIKMAFRWRCAQLCEIEIRFKGSI